MRTMLGMALLLLLAATGCGQSTAAPTAPAGPHVPAQITAWERQVDHLQDLIGGSPRERAAGDLVLFHREQDPFTQCMRAGGVADYTPPAWADLWRLRDSRNLGTGGTAFLQPIDDPDLLVRVERGEAYAQRVAGADEGRSNRAYASLGPAAKARWDRTVKHCHLGRVSPEGWHPAAGYQHLMNALSGLTAIGDAAAAGRARGYKRCMTRAGYPADNASALVDMLLPSVPPQQVPPQGRGGPQFQAYAARVHTAMAADARCRRPAFLAGWRALGPRIGPWKRSHAAAIAALHRRWEALVATAEHQPGWDRPV